MNVFKGIGYYKVLGTPFVSRAGGGIYGGSCHGLNFDPVNIRGIRLHIFSQEIRSKGLYRAI